MATGYNACVDLLDRNVETGREAHAAVVTRDRTVTYAELLAEVEATATGLRRLGVRPEQRVAMVMLDSIEFFDVFLGALRIGAVPAPVNPLLPATRPRHHRRRPAAPRCSSSPPSEQLMWTPSAPPPPTSPR